MSRQPYGYVSIRCRFGEHQDCQDHPVVLCDCPCHLGPEAVEEETD